MTEMPEAIAGWPEDIQRAIREGGNTAIFSELRRMIHERAEPHSALFGMIYESGCGSVLPSVELAFKWYEKGAYEKSEGEGFFGIGRFYFNGTYVERDIKRGVEYLNRAYELGVFQAGIVLGYCYLYGCGLPADLSRADFYLKRPREEEYVYARYLYAVLLIKRRRVIRVSMEYLKCVWQGATLRSTDPDHPKLYALGKDPLS